MAATNPGELSASERLFLALIVSLGVHFALVIGIQGRPHDAGGASFAPLTASLEYLPATDPAAVSNAPDAFVSAAAQSDPQASPEAPPTDVQGKAETQTPPSVAKPDPSEHRASLEVPVIRDPTYYAARFLDEYPRPLSAIVPRYPAQASAADISGKVTLLLLIDADGTLNEMTVVEAIPESIFEEAAMAAFRDVHFSPARKDGRAVRSRVLITVGFEANVPSSTRPGTEQ